MHRALLHCLVLVSALLIGERATAEASLFIYPTLVTFDDNRTSAEVTIANRGDEVGTFEIGFANMSMTAEGGLVMHEEPVDWSIQPFLRYSPRRATLPPGESQVIRIALRRDDTVPEGEYYSHLRVLTINSAAVDGDDTGPSSEPGVSITARSAIAIPVIWRNSRAAPAATIDAVEPDADANALTVDVTRHGLLSARGFVHVVAGGKPGDSDPIAEPMPLILYPNIDHRSVSIPLPEGVAPNALPADTIVVYSADDTLTDTSVIYSQRSVMPQR